MPTRVREHGQRVQVVEASRHFGDDVRDLAVTGDREHAMISELDWLLVPKK